MILFLPISAYVTQATNLKETTSRGVETSFTARFNRGLRLQAGYTWTHARMLETPNVQIPHQPAHSAFASANIELAGLFDIFEKHLRSFELRTSVQGRSAIQLNHFGTLSSAGNITLDLGATIKPTRWFQAGLSFENLLDDRMIVDSLQRPLPGRALYLSITLIATN